MNIKELLKQHILTILCTVALILLFLPFFSMNTEMEILGQSSSSSTTITGFDAIKEVFLGWGLVIGPILLVAMNYVKQLEKHKGLLSIIVPVVCLFIEIITFFQAKGASASASGGNGMASAEIRASLGIGFFALLLVYLGMIVAGAVLYHNFTLDKAGLERLKSEGTDIFGDGLNKIKEGRTNIINSASEKISNIQANPTNTTNDETQKVVKKSINHNKIQETLDLIEKLSTMKDNGILTEEEFTTKKQELLEEI